MRHPHTLQMRNYSVAELGMALIVVALTIALLVTRRNGSASAKRQLPPSGSWVLVVTLKFSDAEKLAAFEEIFRPVADYVRAHEPSTLSYDLLKSDKEPLQVMIFERYADKEHAYLEVANSLSENEPARLLCSTTDGLLLGMYQVHRSSTPFLEFRPKLAALAPEMSGHSYYDSVW
jgi:hypothetical protein